MDWGALFPSEIMSVLDSGFMGFKVWHLLILALIIPYPLMFVILFLLIPGFKDKALEVIKNGFSSGSLSAVYPGVSALSGEVRKGGSEGGPQGSPEA